MKIDGKELKITPSSFDEVMDLQDAVGKAITSQKLDIKFDASKADFTEQDLGGLLSSIVALITSKEVRSCLFKCAERSLFEADKVDKEFFDKVENRKYFYPIMTEILKVNIGPLFESLFSLFSAKFPTLTEKLQK